MLACSARPPNSIGPRRSLNDACAAPGCSERMRYRCMIAPTPPVSNAGRNTSPHENSAHHHNPIETWRRLAARRTKPAGGRGQAGRLARPATTSAAPPPSTAPLTPPAGLATSSRPWRPGRQRPGSRPAPPRAHFTPPPPPPPHRQPARPCRNSAARPAPPTLTAPPAPPPAAARPPAARVRPTRPARSPMPCAQASAYACRVLGCTLRAGTASCGELAAPASSRAQLPAPSSPQPLLRAICWRRGQLPAGGRAMCACRRRRRRRIQVTKAGCLLRAGSEAARAPGYLLCRERRERPQAQDTPRCRCHTEPQHTPQAQKRPARPRGRPHWL
jgi:hypothetical protein